MKTFDYSAFSSMEELAQSQNTQVFEVLHTGVALFSVQGILLYLNRAFMEMFSLSEHALGEHVSALFLTSEQGVMEAIRTREMTVCSSVTSDNSQGVSFRYPIINKNGELLGVIVEAIPVNIDKDKLLTLLGTIKNLEEKAEYLEYKILKKPGMLYTFDSIVGESAAMLEMKKAGRRFGRSAEHILLFGESGTGKELVAQALHSSSSRATKPFVTVNCAALPQELIESELFGYEAGAFTGAKTTGMKGKFELADSGTIFLDEIGDLPMPMQAKLLRVLESGEVQKIGHSGCLHSDFRLIAASNKNLLTLVEQGVFREDLYHRLNILELIVPPLRERICDIPLLVRHFMDASLGRKRTKEMSVSNEVYRIFSRYPWRGNVRELRNVLTFALYDMENEEKILSVHHLPARFLREAGDEDSKNVKKDQNESRKMAQASADAERSALLAALNSTKNNKTMAAHILGISRNKLYKKMRDLNVPTG